MRVRLLLVPAAVLLLAACDSSGQADHTGGTAIAVSSTAACSDALPLRERAAEVRHRGLVVSSDQARLLLANRANFLASLAVAAELQCVVTLHDVEDALQAALQAARDAEGTAGFYAAATRWTEANSAVVRVIELLVQGLPPSPTGG
jgi:dihydroorotase-like cyclic amidohydrolase